MSRLIKLTIAFVLLIGGGLLFSNRILNPRADDAVLTSRLVSIKSPIDGSILVIEPIEEDLIEQGASIALLRDDRADRDRLNELEADHLRLQGEISAARNALRSLDERKSLFEARASQFTGARSRQMASRVSQLEKSLAAAEGESRRAARAAGRLDQLVKSGAVSVASSDDAKTKAQTAQAEAHALREELSQARITATSLSNGSLLGADGQDLPYSGQRLDELALRTIQTEQELGRLEAAFSANEARIEAERSRFGKAEEARITAPSRAKLWRRQAEQGAQALKGDPLFTLAPCDDMLALAAVSRRALEAVRPGQMAEVTLNGKTLQARVLRIEAGAPTALSERYAVIPAPDESPDGYVFLALLDKTGEACPIGRRVAVTFGSSGALAAPAPVVVPVRSPL